MRSSPAVLIRRLTTVVLCAWAYPSRTPRSRFGTRSRAPGSVVVLRHSFAPGGFDPPDARLDDCSTQRNLDARGRAQAQRIGDAFRQNAGSRSARCGRARGAAVWTPRAWPSGRRSRGRCLQGALNDAERRQRQLAEIKGRHRGTPERTAAGTGDTRQRRERPDRAHHPDGRARRPAARARWQPRGRRPALRRLKAIDGCRRRPWRTCWAASSRSPTRRRGSTTTCRSRPGVPTFGFTVDVGKDLVRSLIIFVPGNDAGHP